MNFVCKAVVNHNAFLFGSFNTDTERQRAWAKSNPICLASRKKLGGLDLVAADQALVVSYIQTNEFDKARELAAYGATNAGQYAAMYQNMPNEIPGFEWVEP